MKCPCCGVEIEAKDMSLAFGLPDDLFKLPPDLRRARAEMREDFCILEGHRFFIRGVLDVPVQDVGARFSWGMWAEVPEKTFVKYLEYFDKDGSAQPPVAGVLANIPPNYAEDGYPAVSVQFGAAGQRPVFTVQPGESELYREQTGGMPARKWHELISLLSGRAGGLEGPMH